MITVVSFEQTCGACPSQWECVADDGRAVYIRYRHGLFSASVAATIDDATMIPDRLGDPPKGEWIYRLDTGDEFGGVMSTAEMQEVLKDYVRFTHPLPDGLRNFPPFRQSLLTDFEQAP